MYDRMTRARAEAILDRANAEAAEDYRTQLRRLYAVLAVIFTLLVIWTVAPKAIGQYHHDLQEY
jgi:hypothetical protein